MEPSIGGLDHKGAFQGALGRFGETSPLKGNSLSPVTPGVRTAL